MKASMRKTTYLLSGLTREELVGDKITQLMERFADRFCDRLGLDRRSVEAAHSEIVNATRPESATTPNRNSAGQHGEVAA